MTEDRVDEEIRQILKGLLAATRALHAAMDRTLSSRVETHWRFVSLRDYMAKYQDIAQQVAQVIKITVPITFWDLSKVNRRWRSLDWSKKNIFEAVYTNVLLLESFLENEIGVKDDEIRALSDFFQVNLRRAVFDVPE